MAVDLFMAIHLSEFFGNFCKAWLWSRMVLEPLHRICEVIGYRNSEHHLGRCHVCEVWKENSSGSHFFEVCICRRSKEIMSADETYDLVLLFTIPMTSMREAEALWIPWKQNVIYIFIHLFFYFTVFSDWILKNHNRSSRISQFILSWKCCSNDKRWWWLVCRY